jgi:hypothetical protein
MQLSLLIPIHLWNVFAVSQNGILVGGFNTSEKYESQLG